MTRDAVTRALTGDVMDALYDCAHKGRTGSRAALREIILDALARAGLLDESPQEADKTHIRRLSSELEHANAIIGQIGMVMIGHTVQPKVMLVQQLIDLLEAAAARAPHEGTPNSFPHYFDKGRCSGHAQFNGRYCRDVAAPDRWCIHCAGFMLQQQLAAPSPPPIVERGWALRRKDDPAVFAFIEFGAQIGRTKALSQIQLWAYVEAAFSWLPPPARLEWEPVYVTRAVSVSISLEAPAEEQS